MEVKCQARIADGIVSEEDILLVDPTVERSEMCVDWLSATP